MPHAAHAAGPLCARPQVEVDSPAAAQVRLQACSELEVAFAARDAAVGEPLKEVDWASSVRLDPVAASIAPVVQPDVVPL